MKENVDEPHMAPREDSLDSIIGAPDSVLGVPSTPKTLSVQDYRDKLLSIQHPRCHKED